MLFAVADARTFDKGQLADPVLYPDAAITAAEARIRARFEAILGYYLEPTTVTVQCDGTGLASITLPDVYVTAVSAASMDGVALDPTTDLNPADYTLGLAIDPTGILTRRSGGWTQGVGNVSISYTCGLAAAPADIVRAALLVAIEEMPQSNLQPQAISYTDSGASYQLLTPGLNKNAWYRTPEVNEVLVEHRNALQGVH
jgi:hypothetical protein